MTNRVFHILFVICKKTWYHICMKTFIKNKKFMVIITGVLIVAIVLSVIILLIPSKTKTFSHELPVLEINTEDEKLPVDKVNYVNSSFKMYNTEDDDEYGLEVTMKQEYGADNSVGIRLRGNSTMKYSKKPYRIKFDEKQSFFGSAKNKNWVLLADYLDPSLIKNYSALTLAKVFNNMPWNSFGTHVNLYLNGEYKGIYLLCDQLDEKSGRLDLETNDAYKEG